MKRGLSGLVRVCWALRSSIELCADVLAVVTLAVDRSADPSCSMTDGRSGMSADGGLDR